MADKTLSIVIPLYNEEATVTELLDRVLAVDLPTGREIIIVNDGSTDETTLQALAEVEKAGIQVVHSEPLDPGTSPG